MSASPVPLTETDRQFLAAFEACEFGADDFRHRDHVRLAYLYLRLHSFESALQKIEAGLLALLAHVGAPPSKYHRTLTEAWLLAVQHFMQRGNSGAGFDDFLAGPGAALLDKEIMGTHYSAERLWSEEARKSFVRPDLDPIPTTPPEPAALARTLDRRSDRRRRR